MEEIKLPEISQDHVDSVFRLLGGMVVLLDPSPLEFGPRRLNQKVAACRRHLSELEDLFLKVAAWSQKYRKAHRDLETLFGLEMKNLIANDPETRAGRNQAVQEAIASMKLRPQVEEVFQMKSVLQDLDTLITVIKSKRADLKDTQSRLRDQIKLCQEEIGLGGRWGSKPAPGSPAPDLEDAPRTDRTSLKELQEMFEGVRVDGTELAKAVPVDSGLEPDPEPASIILPTESEPAPVSEEKPLEDSASGEDVDQALEALDTNFGAKPERKPLDVDALLADFGIE